MCRSKNSTSCPQWPDRCCLCFSQTGGVVITGILTILNNICTILLCAYAIVNAKFWAEGYNAVESWIYHNKWDDEFSLYVHNLLTVVNRWRVQILSVLIGYACAAIVNSMLMVLGVCLQGRMRHLLLPWLVYDLVTISVMFLTFVTWAFLSFFVHVLVAIIFPIIAGAILGLYIYLWRNVKDVYFTYAATSAAHNAAKVRHKAGAGSSHSAMAQQADRGKTYTMLHSPPTSHRA